MEISVETSGNQRTVALCGEMTIYAAAELKDKLVAPVADGAETEINLSRVTEIDTAGLQLLILAKRQAAGEARVLRLAGHSQPVLDLLELYNMSAFFGDPVVIPANERGSAHAGGKP